MQRSKSFVIEGRVTTQVRATEHLDGTLSFEFTVLGAGDMRDLVEVFLDLSRPLDADGFADGFKVFGDAGITLGACVAEGIDTLGRRVTITQPAINALGDFDIGIGFGGIGFGRCAAGRAAPRTTGFTLAHDSTPLTLDLIDTSDFGLRYAGPVPAAADLVGPGGPAARADTAAGQDALKVIEIEAVSARPLADDANGGVLAVIDLTSARDRFAAAPGALDGDIEGWGHPHYGGAVALTAILTHEA